MLQCDGGGINNKIPRLLVFKRRAMFFNRKHCGLCNFIFLGSLLNADTGIHTYSSIREEA